VAQGEGRISRIAGDFSDKFGLWNRDLVSRRILVKSDPDPHLNVFEGCTEVVADSLGKSLQVIPSCAEMFRDCALLFRRERTEEGADGDVGLNGVLGPGHLLSLADRAAAGWKAPLAYA
jgi:hypothetical protein